MAKIRTRARAVDMLGRQQIAGISNALTELFKNAHDAYAKDVCVDYFENVGPNNEGFIIIRDDGTGMTKEDFEEKWLVLGTESKVGESRRQQFVPNGMQPRPVTGEKGIGRLAIALLGNQVLILTRALRDDGLHDLVVALIHWGLFEIPGLNLEDIEIPLVTFPGGILPSQETIASLQEQLRNSIRKIAQTHPALSLEHFFSDIDGFSPDPKALDEFFSARNVKSLSLKDDGCGTHFFIGPSNPVIKFQIDTELRENDYSFRKQLLGFTDITFGDQSLPLIQTSFKKWLPGDIDGEEFLQPENFFTREELMQKSDHFLGGHVDKFGQFHGTLRVYDKIYDNLIVPWGEAEGKETKCGPFSINFGYIMGRASESMLPSEDYWGLNNKTNHLGGMYVYRDRVRVLPYGDYFHDWLDVEKRRNKSAGYYFFSYRRMFGAVLLTREKNGNLQEKAGREGFQQNEPYTQLQRILINLLLQLVANFFRKDGTNTELFEQTQADLRKRSEALERQQKRSAAKRKAFAAAISTFSHEVSTGLPEAAIASLRRLTQKRMEEASKIEDQDKAAAALIRAEQEALSKLSELREKYTLKKPVGVALPQALQRDWEYYLQEKSRLENELFSAFQEETNKNLGAVAEQARIYVDQRKRLEERIKQLANERKRQLEAASKQVNDTASDTRQTVLKITERARLALDQTINNIQADLNRTDLGKLSPESIEQMRKKWEDELVEIEERHRDALIAARDMLASLAEGLRASGGEDPGLIMEALEQRVLSLEEQSDEDFEMVQLGLAVAIINHEFAASIKSVRRSIQDLGQLSRKTTTLRPLYDSIKINFEHLDGHLNLFTPLQRRLYRQVQKISGKSLRNYVNDLFLNRFKRHDVNIKCTENFLNSSVECYPSTLYPAIINIVDNAIFWLSNIRENRVICFDAHGNALFISNNGPKIEDRDRRNIMERGFSRKPDGRGLGLFISSKAVQVEGMSLSLEPSDGEYNTIFKITIPTLVVTTDEHI